MLTSHSPPHAGPSSQKKHLRLGIRFGMVEVAMGEPGSGVVMFREAGFVLGVKLRLRSRFRDSEATIVDA
jgi:hypothetical protein